MLKIMAPRGKNQNEGGYNDRTKSRIEGMSRQHCVMRAKKAVDQLPGVYKA
jgi:hypothetical protein